MIDLAVWLTWWGDGRGRPSNDVGYWLSIFTVMAAIEAILISLAIMSVLPHNKHQLPPINANYRHFLLIIGPTVSKKFHTRILNAVMR